MATYATTTNFNRETYETLTLDDVQAYEESGARIEILSDAVRKFSLDGIEVYLVKAKSPGDAQRALNAATA